MDKAQEFRIDAYEKTGQPKAASVDRPVEPMPFQSYQFATNGITPHSIDFRCLNGKRFGMGYSYLQKLEYNPDPVDEAIVLLFSSCEVTIKGVNLEFIYEAFLNRRLVWVKEVNGNLLERYAKLTAGNKQMDGIPTVIKLEKS